MGLFGRKKDPYADIDLDEEIPLSGKASERIIFEKMTLDDQKAKNLLDSMKAGSPLVLNFDGMEVREADKYMAFFQGAAAALDGRAVRINDSTYLYARRDEFLDGSLKEFVENIPSK